MKTSYKFSGVIVLCVAVLLLFSVFVNADASDAYTTTRINDWLLNYHIASVNQLQSGIKGGEGAQLVHSMDISPHNTSILLLGNDTFGIYRSDDGGTNWLPSSEGLGATGICSIKFDPDIENTVYAYGSTKSETSTRVKYGKIGIYKSVDNGNTWNIVLPLSASCRVGDVMAFGRLKPDGTRALYVGANDVTEWDGIASGTTGLFVSYNHGDTWNCLGLQDAAIRGIYASQTTDLIVVATNKGVYVSTDGGVTFVLKNNGLPSVDVTSITVNPTNSLHMIVGLANNGAYLAESYDGGDNWSVIDKCYGADGSYPALLYFHTPTGVSNPRLYVQLYKVTYPSRYSDDYGKTLIKPDFKINEEYNLLETYNGYFPTPYCFNPQNPDVIYTSLITPFKSTDGGETFKFSGSGYSGFLAYDWLFDENGKIKFMTIADLGLTRFDMSNNSFYRPATSLLKPPLFDGGSTSTSVVLDPADSNHGFMTYGGYVSDLKSTIMETFDGFQTVTNVEDVTDFVNTSDEVYSSKFLKYHPQNNNVIYSDWFVSEDNGQSWRKTDKRIRAVSGFDGDVVYSLTDYRIYKSEDKGLTWIDTGLSVPARGLYRAVLADSFYPDVLWIAEHSKVYRVDIINSFISVMDGGINKITSDMGGELEINSIVQNPKNAKHLLISTRDYKVTGGGSVFETLDNGLNWHEVQGIYDNTAVFEMKFHPTENLVFMGTYMGTLVYEYDKAPHYNKPTIYEKYDARSKKFTMSGSMGIDYAYLPVKLELFHGSDVNSDYHTIKQGITDAYGNFSISCNKVMDMTGDYFARLSFFGDSNVYETSFSTGYVFDSWIKPSVKWDSTSNNIIVSGDAMAGDYVTVIMKSWEEPDSGITNSNVKEFVKYVGSAVTDEYGKYECKFKITQETAENIRNYVVYVAVNDEMSNLLEIELADNVAWYGNIKVTNENGKPFAIGTDSKIFVTAKMSQFFEDSKNIALIVSFFGENNTLLTLMTSEKMFDYSPEPVTLSGNVPDGTDYVKYYLWSDFNKIIPVEIK